MADRNPLRIKVVGPLAPFAAGVCAELARRGYTPRSAGEQVYLMAQLSGWLADAGLDAGALTSQVAGEFLGVRRAVGHRRRVSARALEVLLGVMRELGAVPRPVARACTTPVAALMDRYRAFLVCERGLAEHTVTRYVRIAVMFLEQFPVPAADLSLLTTGHVTAFVIHECEFRRAGSAKAMMAGLRSFLRFVHVQGLAPGPLAPAVPAVAGWKLSALPRTLAVGQVAMLLDSCDRRTPLGRRDYAILLLLSRLGLRAGEVALLGVDDVDWRAGELTIRGKGNRLERLPLPAQVGAAMADYLTRGRPRCQSRRLFITVVAPRIGLSPGAVTQVVARACGRAGVPVVRAHRLRHFAACQMLRAGAPLAEVGQVLRHRDQSTTAIYAKVDQAALATLARPWPAGAA
jgi:site-specific recombinase XerD